MSNKVLIVDDDLETLRLVGLMLQRQGYEIVAATNGTQAIGIARTEKPALIVLDIMMPDMDGYEVTRTLRKDPDTSSIPIIQFTAKSQVDDKVEGIESGADDYLTKPVHPAELVARIKGLLSRGRPKDVEAQKIGYTIGVVAPKGGICTSSVVLNLALAYHNNTKAKTIAAELRPSQGTWAAELGFGEQNGLTKLLKYKSTDISNQLVDNELLQTTRGIRLLLASNAIKDGELVTATNQLFEICHRLPNLAEIVFLDIGTPYLPSFNKIITICQEIILITEPIPFTIQKTRPLIEAMLEYGFGKSKFLTLVQTNRAGAAIQMTALQVQDALKFPISVVIPPGAEQAFHSFQKSMPIIEFQPNSIIAQQYFKLADLVHSHIAL